MAGSPQFEIHIHMRIGDALGLNFSCHQPYSETPHKRTTIFQGQAGKSS